MLFRQVEGGGGCRSREWVVRDRELSTAQEAGMEAGWLIHEVAQRTRCCHFPPLVATCTNGDNGGWFRNTSLQANFWPVFYRNLPQRIRNNQSEGIRPCIIDDYLDRHGACGEVKVRPRAWNTGWHDGSGFTQWISSSTPQRTLTRLGRDQPGHPRGPPQSGRHRSPRPGCMPPARASPPAGLAGRDQLQLFSEATPGCSAATTVSTRHGLPGSGSGAYHLIPPDYVLPAN